VALAARRPISVIFIPATVFDNPPLLRVNPEYFNYLLSLPLLERERLLGGIGRSGRRPGSISGGSGAPLSTRSRAQLDVVRYWDLAATEKNEFNDADWTVGIKLGRDKSGGYYLLDMMRARANPGDVERLLLDIAKQDGTRVRVGFGQVRGKPARARRITWCAHSRLYRNAGSGKWRQAHALRAAQLAVSRRQRQHPARLVERGAVAGPRRLPGDRP